MKKVAIIILTHNKKKMLEEALKSVFKKTNYKNYKVFLVDNGSVDKHNLMVKKKFPEVEVIRKEVNLGYSKGNNIGIKRAYEVYDPDYFILLNDDIEIIDKNWLRKMIKVAESDQKIGVVGSQSIYPDGSFQSSGGHIKNWLITMTLNFKEGDIIDVDHLDIVCVLVKKEVMDEVKGFDEDFTPFLLEDTDYCLRVKEKGYSIKLDTTVRIIHKKSQTIKSMNNKLSLLIRFKNDIIFSKRHLSLRNKLFRIFIFLPMVAMFKKRRDEDELKFKNFKLRDDFLVNLYYYFISFNRKIYKGLLRRNGIVI